MDSNSCLYDGENIVKNVCPGGYVLGDEGSEIVLGKMFIADFVKDITPYVLSASFIDQFGLTMEDILQIIYNEPNPTALLSKAARFLWEHLENEYVQDLVVNNIRDFFRRNICLYDYKDYKIRFVGSTAVNYSGFLKQVAAEFDAEVDIIQESSIPRLIEYYELMSGLPK
jgi:N-acetylglucosamine kinase-like BadF-type ATPase